MQTFVSSRIEAAWLSTSQWTSMSRSEYDWPSFSMRLWMYSGCRRWYLSLARDCYQQVTRTGASGRSGVDALQVEQTSRGTDLVVWYDVAVLPLHGADVRDDWVPFLRAARTGQCAPAPSEHNEERT